MEMVTLNKEKELPEGWELKKLNTFATIVMGQSPSSKTYNESKNGLPFFQGKKEFGKINPIPVKWCSSPLRIAEKGDILMSVRAPVGSLNISTEKCCIGRGLCAIRVKELVLQDYLWHYLKLKEKEFSFQGRGTTFDSISKDDVYSYEVPIPFPNDKEKSLKIQKQIVAKLDAFFKEYDILKEEKEKAQENYDNILRGAVTKLVSPDEILSTWRKAKIGDEKICKIITSGGTPDRKKLEYYENGTIPWVKSGELKGSEILFGEEFITESGLKNSSAKYFEPNTVLVAMYGANVGKTAILKIKATTNQAICGLTANEDVIRYEYLFYYFLSKKNELLNKSFGGAQSNISQGVIKDLEIMIPPLNQQDEIVKRIKEIVDFKAIVVEEQKTLNINLKHLPHSVLTKAFAGELV